MSVSLSAYVDFVSIFVRYRSKQRTLELLAMPTKMVSTMVFFHFKKFFMRDENPVKFHKCLFKAYTHYTF